MTIKDLFPEGSRVLLTGTGRQFIERIGVIATRRGVLAVLMGENVRTQTEPLTRRRVAQLSGALVALYTNGLLNVADFTNQLSDMAVRQITTSKRNDKANIWPAQWLIGLTGKSDQNVLRSNPEKRKEYLADFGLAVAEAAEICRTDIGDLRMQLGFVEDPAGRRVELNWKDITRLTTAIGSATLTIRGSDKAIYGKLFERLVLGSCLTILGFKRVNRVTNQQTEKVFWLSDSSDTRESDATLLYQLGKLARFDIGFIGPGNSEISKDKLSRYAREIEIAGTKHHSVTFILVDRLPETSKTMHAATEIGAEIIQMSMQYWPRDLAQRLAKYFPFSHELQTMPDADIGRYMAARLAPIPIQDFLTGVAIETLEAEAVAELAVDLLEPADEDDE